MLIRIYILVLITIFGILAVKNSHTTATRRYFMKRDFFNGFKSAEFSIFDSSEKVLLYRIESYHVLGGSIELIDSLSKQVTGKLRSTVNIFSYEGNFQIFNSSSNQWINGKIERIFNVFNEKYLIKWNGYSILMETKPLSLTTTFEYEYHSGILAEIKQRSLTILRSKYDLKIYSDDLPHAIYFLAIAVKDQNSRSRSKG